MTSQILPDYNGNSIINLMSTIISNYGGQSEYPHLTLLQPSELEKNTNIVLIILDGLGYKFLSEYGKNTILYEKLKGKMTSVFPSTTAAALTTFFSGLAPQNHAILSWFLYLRELGLVSTILKMTVRGLNTSILNNNYSPTSFFSFKSPMDDFQVKKFLILPNDIINSDYSRNVYMSGSRIGYHGLNDFYTQISDLIKKSDESKFIAGYWPQFDHIAHMYGINSKEAQRHLKKLERALIRFLESIEDYSSNTKVIITADHGQIDIPQQNIINLNKITELESTLTLPISGEFRAPFFYVRPSKINQFESYIENNLSHIGMLIKGEDLISKNYFGYGKPHPRLFDRTGDYVFLIKENYIIKDELLSQNKNDPALIGYHGGLSEDEMLVPLIEI
ncbi:MAG: alkaline phosphatase family protein [archaeon]|nr:alkaline phosphatase family protein [archaeon]